MICEVEGGGKIATIVPEGTRVKKGDEVARFDTDALQKAINEQEVKWEQADGKVKAAQSELEVQKNKEPREIAKANLALTLAKIDLESYEDKEGEYQVELDKRQRRHRAGQEGPEGGRGQPGVHPRAGEEGVRPAGAAAGQGTDRRVASGSASASRRPT